VFFAVAITTLAGAALSARAIAARHRDAMRLAAGWQAMAAIERARAAVRALEAACRGPAVPGGPDRCAEAGDEVAAAAGGLRAAHLAQGGPLADLLEELAPTAAGGSGPERSPAVAPAEPDVALRAVAEDQRRVVAEHERRAVGSASDARALVLAANAALLALVVIAALAVQGHLRERGRREAEQARAVALHQELLGIVGHDLRSPLSAIAGSAALLARAPDLPSSGVRLAQRIVSSAGRMSRLVRDLLDLTRVRAAGGLPISPEQVDLGELCRRIAQEVRTARPDALIACDEEGDLRGEWDPGRLEQLVSNLVTNACLHGASGRPIRVRARAAGAAVELEVHNEGPPIPPELLPHVFEAYQRGAGAPGAEGSLGLGLHIARTVVEAHGGRLAVASGAGGTTFTARLPRAAPGAGSRSGAPASPPPSALPSTRPPLPAAGRERAVTRAR
jgi:signal transduction histidine kinase